MLELTLILVSLFRLPFRELANALSTCSSYTVCFAKESQRCVDSDEMVLRNSSYTDLNRTLAGNPETSLYYLLPLA